MCCHLHAQIPMQPAHCDMHVTLRQSILQYCWFLSESHATAQPRLASNTHCDMHVTLLTGLRMRHGLPSCSSFFVWRANVPQSMPLSGGLQQHQGRHMLEIWSCKLWNGRHAELMASGVLCQRQTSSPWIASLAHAIFSLTLLIRIFSGTTIGLAMSWTHSKLNHCSWLQSGSSKPGFRSSSLRVYPESSLAVGHLYIKTLNYSRIESLWFAMECCNAWESAHVFITDS